MGKPIIDDEPWTLIAPSLPPPKPRREKNPGRLPVSNRAVLTGILFVLETGLRWRDLSAEMGCGSGLTCWRRLRDWPAAGVWDRPHELLLAKLRATDPIDFSRAAVDSSSIRAVGAGQKPGQTKGFPEAINSVCPETTVQTCNVHLIRNSLDFVSRKDRKAAATALKEVHRGASGRGSRRRAGRL